MTPEQRALVEQHRALVPWFLGRFTARPDLLRGVDDLGQDGYLGLCRAAQTWQPERGTFATWATLCIRREVIDAGRRLYGRHYQRAVPCLSLDTPLGEDNDGTIADLLLDDDPALDPETVCARHETQAAVQAAVASLPARERCVVAQIGFGGRNQAGIAPTLGISASRVSQLYQRGLRQMAGHLTGGAA